MKRGGTIGGALGVLVLSALFMLRSPGGPDTSPGQAPGRGKISRTAGAEKKSKARNKKVFPAVGPWLASREHFAGISGSSGCDQSAEHPGAPNQNDPAYRLSGAAELEQGDGSVEIKSPRKDLWNIPRCEKVQALIAVVADPVHTRLALAFDRTVEAVQLAAESSGYLIDRYWLPWDTEPRGDWSEYDSYKQAEKDERARLQQPGLLIFRWNGDIGRQDSGQTAPPEQGAALAQPARLIYVFLVADTSTAGINGRQFGNAVDYVRQICDSPRGCTAAETKERGIRLLGPTFSGSLASLRQLTLQAQPEIRPDGAATEFVAYSGSVSSICAIQNQHLGIANPQLCDEVIRPQDVAPWLRFRSFVVPSELSVYRLIEFLQENAGLNCDASHPEVAILAEAATTYGAAQRRPAGKRQRSPRKAIGEEARDPAATRSGEYQDDGGEIPEPVKTCYASFSYPREISSLRNAYHAGGGESGGTSGKTGDTARPYLSFTLADQQGSSDEPRDFSQQQGPLSKEAVLMKMAAELRNNRYKYIGIVGTNGLDVLFLGNFLRTAYPNARLFVISSDLMFERELDNASFIGTLTVSTYPLISRNLDWTQPYWPALATPSVRLPFSDQVEEGEYNATVHLMHEIIPGQTLAPYEMSKPFAATVPGPGGAESRLPVWLTVVGTGGYWPVKILEKKIGDREANAAPPPAADLTKAVLGKTDFSLAWQSLMVLLCVLAFLYALILLFVTPASPHFHDFALGIAVPGQRLFFIQVGSATLALTVAMMANPAWLFDALESPMIIWIAAAARAAVLLLFAACVWMHLGYLLRQPWEWRSVAKGQRRGLVLNALRTIVVHAGIWGFTYWLWRQWSGVFSLDGSLYGFFFAYRSVHMATGVSPITPMLPLLAAGYLWSFFEIWRLRFNDRFRPRLNRVRIPKRFRISALLAGAEREKDVSSSVQNYMLATKYTAGFVGVFSLWLMFFSPAHPFELFEKPGFGLIYEVFFCSVVLMLVSAGFRFGQIWSSLGKLLHEMERAPVRLLLRRLTDTGWSPIWRQGGEESSWINLARSLDNLRALKDCQNDSTYKLKPGLIEFIGGIERNAVAIREKSARAQQRDLIADSSSAIWQYMKCWWKLRSLRRQMEKAKAEKDETQQKSAAEMMKTEKAKAEELTGRLRELWMPAVGGPGDSREIEERFARLQSHLAMVFNEILDALPERWKALNCAPREEPPAAKGDGDGAKPAAPAADEKPASPELKQVGLMEEFVARRYAAFIRNVLFHMKHLLVFMAISFSLVLVSLNLYAFEPHQSLIWSLTVIFVVLGLLTIVALMQIHRDPILSRMSGTQPNDLGFEFYVRILSLGAAPLLTLLATHFPSIGRALVSLLQPGLDALK